MLMAFKTTKRRYVVYKDLKIGDVVVTGYYKRSEKSKGAHSKDEHLDHVFENLEGESVVLYHAGFLTNEMEKVEIGSMVQIIFEGMQEKEKVKKGNNPARKFDVQVDDEVARKMWGMPMAAGSGDNLITDDM